MAKYDSIPGASRFSKSTLDKVYKRGLGAYYSSGSRGVSAKPGLWAVLNHLSVVRVEPEKQIRIYSAKRNHQCQR